MRLPRFLRREPSTPAEAAPPEPKPSFAMEDDLLTKRTRLLTREDAEPILSAAEDALSSGRHTGSDPMTAFQVHSQVSRLDACKALLYGIADMHAMAKPNDSQLDFYVEACSVFTLRLYSCANERDQKLIDNLLPPRAFLDRLGTLNRKSENDRRTITRLVHWHPVHHPLATEALRAGLLPPLPKKPPAELVEAATLRAPGDGVFLAIRKHNSYSGEPESVLIWDEGQLFDMDNSWNAELDTARLALESEGQWLRFFYRDGPMPTDLFLVWIFQNDAWQISVAEQAHA